MRRLICGAALVPLLVALVADSARAERSPAEVMAGSEVVRDVLICEHARCRCQPGEDGEPCASVFCWCIQDPPRGRTFPVSQVESRPPPAAAEPTDAEALSLPSIIQRPTPVAGFTDAYSGASALIEMGYPFLDLRFSFKLHERVGLSFGYRGLWTLTHAGYAGFKFGIVRNRTETFGLSLTLLGGMIGSADNYVGELIGGNSGFGEAILALSRRWGRHALDFLVGTRLGWVDQDCSEYDDYCYDIIFDDGEDGLLVTIFSDLGWSVRLAPFLSFYLAFGVDIFSNSEEWPRALPRFRLGFQIEL